MNPSYRFHYNAFASRFYFIALIMAMVLLIPFPGFFESIVCFIITIIIIGVSLLLCRRDYLIIDETGILRRRLFRSDEFLNWSDIGDYSKSVITGVGLFRAEGFAIVGKNASADNQERVEYRTNFYKFIPIIDFLAGNEEFKGVLDYYKMFIPKNNILAPNEEVEEALSSSIDYYVRQTYRTKKLACAEWDDASHSKWLSRAAGPLAVIGTVILYLYTAMTYVNIVCGEYGEQVLSTLVNGEYFLDSRFIEISSFIVILYLVFIFSPNFLAKRKYLYLSILLVVAVVSSVYFSYTTLPQTKLIMQNCSQPTSAPVEVVKGQVEYCDSRSAFTKMSFIYNNQHYVVRETRLAKCRVGMPILVSIQKGSKGIPIVRDILISDIGWSKQSGFFTKSHPDEQEALSDDMSHKYANEREYRWKTPLTKDWQQQTLIIDGVDKGKWNTLESTTVDLFGSRKLGMVIAIDEDNKQVVFIICEEAPAGGYKRYDVNVEPTISIWFDNNQKHLTLKKDPAEKATWWLGEKDVPTFIRNTRRAYDITLTMNEKTGISSSERKVFVFLVKENAPG